MGVLVRKTPFIVTILRCWAYVARDGRVCVGMYSCCRYFLVSKKTAEQAINLILNFSATACQVSPLRYFLVSKKTAELANNLIPNFSRLCGTLGHHVGGTS